MSSFSEYTRYDGLGLAELVARGEVSPDELLTAALDQCDSQNPRLNAIILDLREQARAQIRAGLPDGPFRGVPFLLKDLSNALAGVPRSSGSRFFADYTPDFDSALVQRYKAAGLVIFGKTNTPEFGTMPITDPELFGSARNPWNPEHTPGGSSGGAGAAVAARIVPMANGGDGGGSIRIPSSCCGLVGLKPSRGRIPVGPEVGEGWFGMATEHVLTRSVRDCAAMLDATGGPDLGAPYGAPPIPKGGYQADARRSPGKLRIAFTTDNWLGRGLHPDCVAGVQASAQRLAALGHEVEEASPPIDRDAFIFAMGVLISADIAAVIRQGEKLLGRKASRDAFEPHNWALLRLGESFNAGQFATARAYLHQVGRDMARFMENYDVLLTSSLGMPPVLCGSLKATGIDALLQTLIGVLPLGRIATRPELLVQSYAPIFDWIPTTPVANASGAPSISLPLHSSADDLPVGMMFTGRFGDDATLLRLAGQLEEEYAWQDQRPPGC